MAMTPLRVTIKLQSPMVVPKHPIHLDGLLSALKVAKEEAAGNVDAWSTQHDLPVDRYESPSGQWVFKASLLTPAPSGEPFMSLMTNRLNATKAAEDIASGLVKYGKAAPNPAGGHFKGGIFALPTQYIETLTGYLVGDRQAVEDLLLDMVFVGARRSQSCGRVASFEVVECEESTGWMHRAMPYDCDLPLSGAVALVHGALRAPYWKKTAHSVVLAPVDF